ncbi:MAG: AMP-binding protein [Acidimicrobiales bacterium]
MTSVPGAAAPIGSVARVLDAALAADPHREALVTRSARLPYVELDRLAHRAAFALRSLGVGPGDRVGASLPNEADVVIAFHGAMRLGAIWVGVNRALAEPEKRFLLSDCDATLLLSDDDVGDVGAGRRPGDLAGRRRRRSRSRGRAPTWTRPRPRASPTRAGPPGAEGRGAQPAQPAAARGGAGGEPGLRPRARKGDCFPFTILNMAVLTTLLVSQAGARRS